MLCLSRCVKVCGQSKSCHFFFVLCVFLIFFEEATIFETCSFFSQALFPDNNPFIFVGNQRIFFGRQTFLKHWQHSEFLEDLIGMILVTRSRCLYMTSSFHGSLVVPWSQTLSPRKTRTMRDGGNLLGTFEALLRDQRLWI